ncbi:MAG: serpin family protein [Deltaproteobacteria bacterium]|jgi:serpin B|nr:serpin family protein [Deltaproteobacteria bacterium]
MKNFTNYIFIIFLIAGCGSKSKNTVENNHPEEIKKPDTNSENTDQTSDKNSKPVKLKNPDQNTVKTIAQGINKMGNSIFNAIAAKVDKRGKSPDSDEIATPKSGTSPKRNIILSSYSLASAFSLAWAGANGKTAQELAQFFNCSLPYPKQHAALGALQNSLDNTKGLKLKIANSLWLEKSMKVEKPWLAKVKSWYSAKPHLVDFINAPQKAEVAINKWVENKTNNRIKDLIPKNSLDKQTRAVLANAIWFLAKWKTPFKKQNTSKMDFYPANNWKIKTDTMMGKIYGKIASFSTGARLVSIPYKGGRFSFIIYLHPHGLSLGKPSPRTLQKLFSTLKPNGFNLYLPKFKLKAKYRLGSILTKKLPLSFSTKADFSKITKTKPGLLISEVFHQTFLKVDEEGTEAAAATALVMKGGSAHTPVPTVKVNRPFLFWIRDNKTGLDLFSGRIVNPNPKAKITSHNPAK